MEFVRLHTVQYGRDSAQSVRLLTADWDLDLGRGKLLAGCKIVSFESIGHTMSESPGFA